MKDFAFCILSKDAMLLNRPPWVRGYENFEQAVEEHVDYKQNIYRIYAERLGNGKYKLEEDTWVEQVKWPVVKEADYAKYKGVLVDDAWGHTIKRSTTELELDALVFIPKEEDRFSFRYGDYNFDVLGFEVVKEFPLWNLVEVTDYDWWS